MSFVPIDISDKAVEEIFHIMQTKNIPSDYQLRVGVKGMAGCAGVNYVLGFDRPKEGDTQFQIKGIPVLIEKKQTMFLAGVELDFYDEAEARGFTFINPHQK